MTASLALITQNAVHPDFINQLNPEHQPIEAAALENIRESHQVVNWLNQLASERAKIADANHILYLVRASQLYLAGQGQSLQQGLQNIQAKTLFLPADNDLILMPYLAKDTHQRLRNLGKNSQYQEISGPLGHLNGVRQIDQASTVLSDFLASE